MAEKRIFHNPSLESREEVLKIFSQEEAGLELCNTMVAVAFHEPDWQWAQNWFLHFLSHPDASVRALAAICLEHLARIHRRLEKEKVIQALRQHLNDEPKVKANVEDTLDAVEWYLKGLKEYDLIF